MVPHSPIRLFLSTLFFASESDYAGTQHIFFLQLGETDGDRFPTLRQRRVARVGCRDGGNAVIDIRVHLAKTHRTCSGRYANVGLIWMVGFDRCHAEFREAVIDPVQPYPIK